MIVLPSSTHWLWKWRLHNLSKDQEIPLSVLRHNREVPGSIPGRVFGNFLVSYSFWPHSVALEYSQPLREVSTKEYPWVLRASGAWSWQLCRHIYPECEIMDESQRSIPSCIFMTRYGEALPFAPLSESVPSHCSPQCRGGLLIFDCLILKVKALGALETAVTVFPTTQRYVRKDLSGQKDVLQERVVPHLVRLRSRCDICDILCIRGVAISSPADCWAAELTTVIWRISITFYGTKTNFTWLNWRTLCGSTVHDHARDHKC